MPRLWNPLQPPREPHADTQDCGEKDQGWERPFTNGLREALIDSGEQIRVRHGLAQTLPEQPNIVEQRPFHSHGVF